MSGENVERSDYEHILRLAVEIVGPGDEAKVAADQAAAFLTKVGVDPLRSTHIRLGMGTAYDARQAMLDPGLFRLLHSGELVLDPDDPRSTPSTDIASGNLRRFDSVGGALKFLRGTEE
jgi:hypothetical protein